VSWSSYRDYALVSACGSPPSATGSCTVDQGSQVVLTAEANAPFVWSRWESPDPGRPCDGVSQVQSPTSASMTFDNLQHDAVCEARAV
jgi:hypothetical protein